MPKVKRDPAASSPDGDDQDFRSAPPAPPPLDAEDLAAYVADLSNELARMSRTAGLDVLAYLLDIVRLEAESTNKRAGRVHPLR